MHSVHTEGDALFLASSPVADLGGLGGLQPPYLPSQEMQKNECTVIKTH